MGTILEQRLRRPLFLFLSANGADMFNGKMKQRHISWVIEMDDIFIYGDIVPGKSIGAFQIGAKAEQLLNMLEKYQIEQRSNCIVVKTSTLWFWLDEENRTFQIKVLDGFLGRFAELIGLGDTISDVEEHFGKCTFESYVVKIPSVEGICFELNDIDDYDQEWDELSAPICSICVYRV